jgi:hypothetical protein
VNFTRDFDNTSGNAERCLNVPLLQAKKGEFPLLQAQLQQKQVESLVKFTRVVGERCTCSEAVPEGAVERVQVRMQE